MKNRLIIGVIFSVLFVLLSSTRLEQQGLYYDELHQAGPAFAYLGSRPERICSLSISNVPVLNLPYNTAIKSNVYGLWLRYVDPHFRILSWRLLGILFVALGILAFCILVRSTLGPIGIILFLSLLVTDATVLLATRHDWGPVALSLTLRLLFLGVWLGGETGGRPLAKNTFALGVIIGFAVLEKLSSVTLMIPLLLIMTLRSWKYSPLNLLTGFAGLLVGSLPLMAINIYTYFVSGKSISLTAFHDVIAKKQGNSFPDYVRDFLSLGTGSGIKSFLLGISTPGIPHSIQIEYTLIALLLLMAAGVSFLQRRNVLAQLSLVSILSYIFIALHLRTLPTWVHHWILATPFQYAAFALAFIVVKKSVPGSTAPLRVLRPVFMATLILFICFRVAMMFPLEKALYDGACSKVWDKSFTEMGLFAKENKEKAVFLASDWGPANAIYCLCDGAPVVYDIFWDYNYDGLRNILAQSNKHIFYLVQMGWFSGVNTKNTVQINEDVGKLPDWREVPVEKNIASLNSLKVRKFVYSPSK